MQIDKKMVWVVVLLALVTVAISTGLVEGLTHLDHAKAICLGIFFLAAVLWVTEWLPSYQTSLIILFLQISWLVPAINPKAGAAARQEYLSAFFCDITLLFMGGFVLAAALQKYGLDNRIAARLLKKTGTKPSRVLLGIMIVSALLSMWMSNTATAAMMLAIILPILRKIPEKNSFAKGLILSIPFACNLGGLGTPIGTPPNAIAMSYLVEKGLAISFSGWMMAAVPLMVLFIISTWLLLLKMYPPGSLEISLPTTQEGSLAPSHWFVMGVFALTILGWCTTGYHGLSLGTVSLLPVFLIFGPGLLNTQDFKQLPWDVLFMMGGGICLGVGLKESGLAGEAVKMIPAELDFFWVLLAFALLAGVMTTFMSNTATANLLIPIAISLPGNISFMTMTIAMVCSTAMALPISTPPNAIAFGSGLLTARDMIRPGLIITVFSLLAILAVGELYWPLLGL
ncbi:MAG: SLC13 family permease [Proteobacteria bacterium]|nr:SLC13 family permease [Pseudomonadota bacterium]MBU1686164.1 SLC13 family permease [Pseudomonadota bacterium]